MSIKIRNELIYKVEKSIAKAVAYQDDNRYGLDHYNSFLLNQLMETICTILAELDKEIGGKNPMTADEYLSQFKERENALRNIEE
ncbi:hypothetical protein [Chondrinema litorale]|uniref:hypothetical protein n=1 Tax=Chondrinema litorale TaxID=2994555 RepID=UPI002542AAD9|nr:hypothetical protein [Chondrinema litorale]UZR93168.1 hypothetical protein OQ292_15010 [Chondrinema litorale]